MLPVVTTDEMRAAEVEFVRRGGDLDDLMHRAGAAAAARAATAKRVLVLAGPGNNGGDGVIAAGILQERGASVTIYALKRRDRDTGQVPRILAEDDTDCSELRRLLSSCDTVVDALFGIGGSRPLEGVAAAIVDEANAASNLQRLAVDIPSGVNGDTGQVPTTAFQADVTITMGFAKTGLFAYPGAGFAGHVEIEPLDMSADLVPRTAAEVASHSDIANMLPRRSQDSNKGRNGTVVVVSGSDLYSGAPVLVGSAAYRIGAGLVRMAVPTAARPIVASHVTEPVYMDLPGAVTHCSPAAVDAVAEAIGKADAFAIGPGLGQNPATIEFVHALLERLSDCEVPGVLDADGLNAVARKPDWWNHAPRNLVLTPHPGEMARLCATTVERIQSDRFGTVATAARTWGLTVLLKGAFTLIGDPSSPTAINTTGGPNLATAGSGDVLTGTIAGLLAQGLRPREAAITGAWIHGAAGDDLATSLGDAGTVASDLLSVLPRVRLRVQCSADQGQRLPRNELFSGERK